MCVCGKCLEKQHVRRHATYSAAIFHLMIEGPGSALELSHRPTQPQKQPTSHERDALVLLTEENE